MRIPGDSGTSRFGDAQIQTHSKLTDAAQQVEAMLMQEILKPMRSSEDEWGGEEKTDSASDTVSSFGTEALAKAVSQRGGLGIARQVVRQVAAERQEISQKGRCGTKV
jgi:Rod binding domain-containing protein